MIRGPPLLLGALLQCAATWRIKWNDHTAIIRLFCEFHDDSSNRFSVMLLTYYNKHGASSVRERSWIDPDFRERSLTKRFVPATALSFLGIKKRRSQQL